MYNETPNQKAKSLIYLFCKENAINCCNEKIEFFKDVNIKRFIDRFNYWNKVKTKIK